LYDLRREIPKILLLYLSSIEKQEFDMPTDNRLIEWAKENGFTLCPAEEKLLANVIQGKPVHGKTRFLTKKCHKPDLAWSLDYTISAKLLSRLILDETAKGFIHPYGIRIYGYYIEGKLRLDTARIPFPLVLQKCYIPKPIELRDANTRLLSFRGSHTGLIEASRIGVESSLALNEGFWAKGEVRLHGGHIKGQFDCRHGRFDNPVKQECASYEEKKYALMADDIKVDCDMYLTGVRAIGPVSLGAAQIFDDLKCEGAHFFNPKGKALVVERIHVGGHVFFNLFEGNNRHKTSYFKAFGQVSLIQAKIKGSLSCRSAVLYDNGQIVLDAREANIAGSVWFEGLKTNGLIRFTGSNIDACLYFVDAKFIGEHRTGFIGKALNVKGTFDWTSIAKMPATQLDLRYATVGQLEDDVDSWPDAGNLILEGLVYNSIVTKITKEIRAAQNSGHLESIKLWFFNRAMFWTSKITGRNKESLRSREQTRIDWLERQLTERFTLNDIEEFPELATQIIQAKDPVSLRLKSRLLKEDLHKIEENQRKDRHLSKIDEKVLLLGLNDLLQDKHLIEEFCKKQQCCFEMRKDIQDLIEQRETRKGLDRHGLALLNCRILKKVYPQIREDANPLQRYFREQPYEQLAAFLLAQGHDTEAKDILIAKYDAKRQYAELPRYARFLMGRYKCATEYGYKPFKAVKKAVGIIFLGFVFFWMGDKNGYMVPSKEYVYMNPPYVEEKNNAELKTKREPPSTYPKFYPLIYSLEVFVPFLDLHQESYWLPGHTVVNDVGQGKQEHEFQECFWPWALHVWMWFEIIIGWFLSTFFVSGIVGLMREFHPHKKE